MELQEFNECVKDCDQAIQINPSFAKAYFRKGKALASLDELNEAKEVVEAGLKLERDNEQLVELAK